MDVITVSLLSGRSLAVPFSDADTATHLRQEVSKTLTIAATRVKLMCNGCEVSDGQSLAELSNYEVAAVVIPSWRVLGGLKDGTLRIWDIDEKACVGILEDSCAVLAVSADFTTGRAVGVCADSTLSLWDLEGLEQLWYCPDIPYPMAVSINVTLQQALIAGRDSLQLLDLNATKPACTPVKLRTEGTFARALEADFVSMRAICACANGLLEVFDLKTMEKVGELRGHSKQVAGLSVCFQTERVVSASFDNTLGIWDLQQLVNVMYLRGHTAEVTAVQANFASQRIISGSLDLTLRVWHTDGSSLGVLQGHAHPITAITLDDEAQRVASSSRDGLRVWDLRSMKCQCEISACNVTSLASNCKS